MTARAGAALTSATQQAAIDETAAAGGAGAKPLPQEEVPTEVPEDLTAIVSFDPNDETMPLLEPSDSEALLEAVVGATGYCDTLDLGICFAAGTPVLMADGTVKPIETLQPGDQVLAAPEHEAEAAPSAKTVEEVFHNPPAELVILTIGDTTLRWTGGPARP
jgi:hypothetical protein